MADVVEVGILLSNGLSAADIDLSTSATPIAAVNAIAQLAAIGASLRVGSSVTSAGEAVLFGEAAFSTGMLALGSDLKALQSNHSSQAYGSVAADFVGLAADVLIVWSAALKGTAPGFPAVQIATRRLDIASAGLTVLSIVIHAATGGYDKNEAALVKNVDNLLQSAGLALNQINQQADMLLSASEGLVQKAISSVQSAISDILGSADTDTDLATASQTLQNAISSAVSAFPQQSLIPQGGSISETDFFSPTNELARLIHRHGRDSLAGVA